MYLGNFSLRNQASFPNAQLCVLIHDSLSGVGELRFFKDALLQPTSFPRPLISMNASLAPNSFRNPVHCFGLSLIRRLASNAFCK